MPSSTRRVAPILIACLSLSAAASAAEGPTTPAAQTAAPTAEAPPLANDAAAEREIRTVVEAFRAAIVAGDSDALRALFLPGSQAWLSVRDDADLARARERDPAAGRLVPGSYDEFARLIANRRQEEVFTGIQIRTDGLVAVVVFDFVYRHDGKAVNRGLETWQLAKTDDGWKIVSLTYSSHHRS